MLALHVLSSFFSKLREGSTDEVDRFVQAMRLHDDQLRDISARFLAEMKKGLSEQSNATAAVKMLPTQVFSTPDGSEKGQFLALDLGGSKFKVLHVKVREGMGKSRGEVEMEEKVYPIPTELLESRGAELFDHVSESLKDFLLEKRISLEQKHPLAFTFSFPCEQAALHQGLILSWSKNFRVRGCRGKDVAQALKEAIDRTGGMDIDIMSVVNDTVATMMTCGFDEKLCEVGLIVGTGTNACYMEDLRHVDLVEGDEGRMCVNTEWGAFGDDGALDDYITEFDREVDAASNNPGKQIFEKMIGGLYLGELVRLVVLKMAKLGHLFDGRVSAALRTAGKIATSDVAAMEEYKDGLKNTRSILTGLGLNPSHDDCVAAQRVSATVAFRSSHLVAAALAAILTRIKQNRNLRTFKVTVGVDGAVYKTHPQYSKRLQKALQRLVPECQVRFVLSESGSSKGAALVTAVAQRLASQKQKVDETLSPFRLSVQQLQVVMSRVRSGLEAGLRRDGTSELKMLPSFVRRTFDGTAHGKYLALKLGGTNLKAVLVNFKDGQQSSQLEPKIYTVPVERMQGTRAELFDFITECVGDFLDYMGIKKARLPAGFTFPFPCSHTAINQGTLVNWTKGFKVADCEGRDVAGMLQQAVKRRNEFELDVVAVLNDTVGTMVSCACEDPQCEVGLVVGTGTNMCYMEELKNIGPEDDGANAEGKGEDAETQRMCINTELGGLGDNGSLDEILSPYDALVDQNSLNPGKQRFEKMTSGMYLGELVRQILLDLTRGGLLFRGNISEALKAPGMFQTKHLSQIESDRVAALQVRCSLHGLGLGGTCEDSIIVKQVCRAVSHRAAQLCGAATAAVVDKMRENRGLDFLNITVGVQGKLYHLHPHFSRVLKETVRVLAPQCDVTFITSQPGKGAALIAAAAREKVFYIGDGEDRTVTCS